MGRRKATDLRVTQCPEVAPRASRIDPLTIAWRPSWHYNGRKKSREVPRWHEVADSTREPGNGAAPVCAPAGPVAAACLALILFLCARRVGCACASAAEANTEQARYEGTLSVLNKPVPVYALDSSSVEIEVTGDTVSVTVEFVLVAVLKWDGDTDLCTATMYRLYRGQGRMGNPVSVELKLVDSSNKLEGPDCEGVQAPVVQSQTLQGTFSDNGTFKGNIRNAWTVTASRVGAQPPTTEASTTTTSVATESSTTTSTTTTADTIPRRWTDAEFEKRVDEMLTRVPAANLRATPPLYQGFIGVVIAATGGDDCRIYDYSGRRVPGPAKGRWIRLGDTIVTGPNGRVRVELADRDDARNAGPSVINMSINSEMSYDSFETQVGRGSTWISLIRGSIRTFFKDSEETQASASKPECRCAASEARTS